jgi:Protein of unknown function (DUF2442)
MEKILKATPLDDYRLEILTSSGIAGIFDVKPYMGRGVFKELADKDYFSQVRPLRYGIAWPNEQDLSSDTIIYDIKHSAELAV